jgi:hypothetical protein
VFTVHVAEVVVLGQKLVVVVLYLEVVVHLLTLGDSYTPLSYQPT